MISANNVTYRVGKKALFEDVNIKFTEGGCYGIIGANGAGKSTFLKILSGQLDTTSGEIAITPGQRLSFLEQDHEKYNDQVVLDTVIQGNQKLYEIGREKDELYAKPDFSDEDGIRAAELESEYAEMGGYESESDAESLLNGLGIEDEYHYQKMGDLNGAQKVKVLLARALFGSPDILLLDEPTNHLDLDAIAWLEEKIKELKEFISRFSANASKSKQATSRKRALEKIELDEIKPSSRKYPFIDFRPDREIGNEVLTVEHLTKTVGGVKLLDDVSFVVKHDDKIAFVGSQEQAKTALFEILMGNMEPDSGSYKWGVTTSQSYFKKDNTDLFDTEEDITQWLTAYSQIKDVTYVRGFLGRMLFRGEDGIKKVKVLSGGEKVRCQLSSMMISGANCLIFDEPTNHLDMESISALNDGMIKFHGVELIACRDHQVVQTTANRIIEILPGGGIIDKETDYDTYLEQDADARKRTVYVADTSADVEEDAE